MWIFDAERIRVPRADIGSNFKFTGRKSASRDDFEEADHVFACEDKPIAISKCYDWDAVGEFDLSYARRRVRF